MQLKRTPLYATHVAAGARIVPFAGWEMPVQYEGVIAEHQAVRNAIGLFDISHMGILDFAGDGVLRFPGRHSDKQSLRPRGESNSL